MYVEEARYLTSTFFSVSAGHKEFLPILHLVALLGKGLKRGVSYRFRVTITVAFHNYLKN